MGVPVESPCIILLVQVYNYELLLYAIQQVSPAIVIDSVQQCLHLLRVIIGT